MSIEPKIVRAEIDTLRGWAVDAEQPFTLESCTEAVCVALHGPALDAWTEALAAEWTDADVVTR